MFQMTFAFVLLCFIYSIKLAAASLNATTHAVDDCFFHSFDPAHVEEPKSTGQFFIKFADQREMYFHSTVGTLPQNRTYYNFNAIFDLSITPILMSSAHCGQRQRGCSVYCNDLAFGPLYCVPLCSPFLSAYQYAQICTEWGLKEINDSLTYVPSTTEWKGDFKCCMLEFFGRFAQEAFRFEGHDKRPPFTLEFVEGFLMQTTIFNSNHMIFGLGRGDSSGRPGFVEQLHDQGHIDAAVITIAGTLGATVGGVDTTNCEDDWMRVPLVEDAVGWTIAVDRIEIFGVPFDNQLITFMDIGANIGIPQLVYRTLIEKDIIFPACSGLSYSRDCVPARAPRQLTFHSGGRVYHSNIETMKSPCTTRFNQTVCDSRAEWDDPDRSYDREAWLMDVFVRYSTSCFLFDYTNRSVWIGKFKKAKT